MMYTKRLVGFTAINFLVFYVLTMIFPNLLVFGNETINPWQAMITAAFGVTIVHILFEPLAEDFKFRRHKDNWLLVFFVVNTAAVYLMARTPFSIGIGMGISAFWVAMIVGAILDIAQYAFSRVVLQLK